MNVDQCKALGLVPYAVYGGKVESFKVRETDPMAYSDPTLMKVLDELIAIKERCSLATSTTRVNMSGTP